jgi:hypothetical protein
MSDLGISGPSWTYTGRSIYWVHALLASSPPIAAQSVSKYGTCILTLAIICLLTSNKKPMHTKITPPYRRQHSLPLPSTVPPLPSQIHDKEYLYIPISKFTPPLTLPKTVQKTSHARRKVLKSNSNNTYKYLYKCKHVSFTQHSCLNYLAYLQVHNLFPAFISLITIAPYSLTANSYGQSSYRVSNLHVRNRPRK